VYGIGGGVCQVSTTLYQAALRAGLKIESRHVHAIPSNYAEKGQDATVTDDGKDLVIRNTGDSPVYIKARFEESKQQKRCVVEIFGTPLPNGMYYKLESKQIGLELEPDPPVKYIKDKKQDYVHYIGQEKEVSRARKGYKIETYLVSYRSDGMESTRSLLTTDLYRPLPAVVYQGVLSREID
jgi:vancomycin resistance protein YoaR